VEKLTHVRSHDNEPPFPGLTLWILLQLPATINDSSVAPGLGMTDPGVFTNRSAFSNIFSRMEAGIVVIPLPFAVHDSPGLFAPFSPHSRSLVGSVISSMWLISACLKSFIFLTT
jgi:hypothetical protein